MDTSLIYYLCYNVVQLALASNLLKAVGTEGVEQRVSSTVATQGSPIRTKGSRGTLYHSPAGKCEEQIESASKFGRSLGDLAVTRTWSRPGI